MSPRLPQTNDGSIKLTGTLNETQMWVCFFPSAQAGETL